MAPPINKINWFDPDNASFPKTNTLYANSIISIINGIKDEKRESDFALFKILNLRLCLIVQC
jgi:hypothetical protein